MSRYRVHLIVGAAILIGGLTGYIVLASGVHVTVRNTGQEVMRDVEVHVTGRVYSLGDLEPGGFRTRRASPTSESHVEVGFRDEQGKQTILDAGGYLEPGYRGQLDIEVKDGKVAAVRDGVRVGPY